MPNSKSNIGQQLVLCGIALVYLIACASAPSKLYSENKCNFDDDTVAMTTINVDKKNDSANFDVSKNQFKNPKLLDDKAPSYPAYAAKKQIEGFVKAVITVKRDGTVESFKIVESCPDTLFNQVVSSIIPALKVTPSDTADTTSLRRFKRTWKFKTDSPVRRRISFGFGYTGGFYPGHFPFLINHEGFLKNNYSIGASLGYTIIQISGDDRYFFEKLSFKKYTAGKYEGLFLGVSLFYGFTHTSTNDIKIALFANPGYLHKWKRIFSSIEGGFGPGFVEDSNRDLEFKPIFFDVHWNFGLAF